MNAASSRPRLPRALTSFLLSIALLAPVATRAAGWDIDQLMQGLAKMKSGRATFTEKKTMSMLDRPLESSGELQYSAPDRLEKRTLKPSPETMVVEGDTLVLQRGRQKHTVQLQEYPEIAGFIDSIRGTLAGDRKALERTFRLKLDGAAERWNLSLTPNDAKLAANIHLIRIGGSREHVRTIEIIQTDGDRSLMTIARIEAQ